MHTFNIKLVPSEGAYNCPFHRPFFDPSWIVIDVMGIPSTSPHLETNSTLRILTQKWSKQIRFYLAHFSYFQPLGYPVGSPLASSCVWTGVATAPCFSVATGVSGIEPPTLEVCGKKYPGNQVSPMSFTQVFQAVTFLGW